MILRNDLKDLFYTSSSKLKGLNIFWLGFALYTMGFVLNRTSHLSSTLCNLIQVIGLVLLLPTGIFLIRAKLKNSYLRTLFIFYILCLLGIVFRGIRFNNQSLHQMLLDADYGIFIYFAPLVILFPKNLSFYKKLFDIILVFGGLFLLCNVLFIKSLLDRSNETRDFIEYFAELLSLPCGFLVLTYIYHSNKRKVLALGIMVLTLLFAIYRARRGLAFITMSILSFSYLIYFFYTTKKTLIIYLSILAMLAGLVYTGYVYKIKNGGLFGLLAQRGEEDTRTVVEVFFDDDMKTKDWMIGKGINGEYFCPDCEEDQETNYRSYIETGYLQIVLKGGIITLGLYLLMAIPAIILGIFFSDNVLSKASGIWIFVSLISLYPATVVTFSLSYLLVWISIGICYSKKIRYLSDNTIKEFFDNSSQYIDNKKL